MLFSEEVLLAVPPWHRLAGRQRVALREAAGEPFISLKAGYWLREPADDACRRAGFVPAMVCEGDEPAAIRSLVAVGLGVAFLPDSSRRAGSEPAVASRCGGAGLPAHGDARLAGRSLPLGGAPVSGVRRRVFCALRGRRRWRA